MQEIIEDGQSSEVEAVLNDERYQSFKVSDFTLIPSLRPHPHDLI